MKTRTYKVTLPEELFLEINWGISTVTATGPASQIIFNDLPRSNQSISKFNFSADNDPGNKTGIVRYADIKRGFFRKIFH